MKLYWIAQCDQKHNNGFFYNLTDHGPRRPWPLYQDLVCPKCLKMPEDVAVARGIDPSFRVRLIGDIAGTDDGVYLFSRRAKEFFEQHEIAGIQFRTIPNENRYVLAFPTVFASLQRPDEMLRHERACPECGRWRWVGFSQVRMEFKVLPSSRAVFQPDTWLENGFARTTTLMCANEIASELRAAMKSKTLAKFYLHEVEPAPAIVAVPMTCQHCTGSGKCYCLRTGSKSSEGCVRCNGTGKCHVCGGVGMK